MSLLAFCPYVPFRQCFYSYVPSGSSTLSRLSRERFFLKIREESSDDAKQRSVGTEIVDGLDAISVSKITKHSRCDTTHAESKAEEQTRNHTELGRKKFLGIKKYGRESRRQHEARTEAQHHRHCQTDMRHEQGERSCAENRHPYHSLAAVTVTDRASDKGTGCSRDNKHKEKHLRKRHRHPETVDKIESIVARQTRHIDILRENQHDNYAYSKYSICARQRQMSLMLLADLTRTEVTEIACIPTADWPHGPEADESENQEESHIAAVVGCDNKRDEQRTCLFYTTPSPRDKSETRMPASALKKKKNQI